MHPDPVIQHDPARHVFELELDGYRAYLSYSDLGERTLDFYRTFVPDELRGRGLAALLTQEALNFARQQGYKVIPSCSYVEAFMKKSSASV